MSDKMVVECTRADLAENLLFLEGKEFSLHDFPFYRHIYNGQWQEMMMMCGRQVAKSTTADKITMCDSIAIDFFKTLYVAPTQKQTSIFSNSRLTPTITGSPFVREEYVSSASQMASWRKSFTNGSEINLSYASDDPDRVRGYSSDRVWYDEIQDIVYDSVIPVVNETMANSDYGWVSYMGTPKSMENTIQILWDRSTQDEWLMKCEGCNKWNFVNSTDSIGKKGVICVNCGKYLNPREGRWHSMNKKGSIKGFHISQLILPKNNEPGDNGEYQRWKRILNKYENYTESKFKNEVLGISDAIGTRMVSLEDLENLCKNYVVHHTPKPSIWEDVRFTVAGIDWSGGGSSTYTSRTVIWVWGILPDGRLKTMYYRIFPQTNPVQDVRDIIKICQTYKCSYVAGDAGMGATPNAMLAEALGTHKVLQFQYGAQKDMCKWNGRDRYMVDKTGAIDTMMLNYLRQAVIFPHKKQMREPIEDIMAEHEEVTKQGAGRKIWSHSPIVPDDSLHAQVFGWLASEVATHKIQFYKADPAVMAEHAKKGKQ